MIKNTYDCISRKRKLDEYNIKITKMSGYLSDYYIDKALETQDYSDISNFLTRYFSGRDTISVEYLVNKYKNYGLNEKVEDIDFDIDEWYNINYEYDFIKNENETSETTSMNIDEYVNYLIKKRQDEGNDDDDVELKSKEYIEFLIYKNRNKK